MAFYESIAPHYHHIFPFNPLHLKLVLDESPDPENNSLLDMGCGIGILSKQLANFFEEVKAIDLDRQMIHRAQSENASKNLEFLEMNMMKMGQQFKTNSFQSIICFGNTLVHLHDEDTMLDLFKQVKSLLKNRGKFLFQIINYDRILDDEIDSLPTIKNDKILFVRTYKPDSSSGLIHFETTLTIKNTGAVIQNSVPLFPIRKNRLDKILNEAGFSLIHYFGNFKKEEWTDKSVPLVVVAQ